ncbi:hypothetical protein GII33_10910 [Gordonia pseudamarae]|uniref:Uncharacterized protein n=1 Tax=Gordonia pseudamarae TaxID=2831662 RepID=A0ABX6IHF9_9ACTN|nr:MULTISPECIES: hypothetical protein [Gordonia]MBD0021439.1 hypothetical protein [Gordonia sp. (in: high G+C Gram-positive bacteria)]QHN26400.1 hypothetical protein GII33_10910 [Gordonia pseudamarae]QHN35295.1 hypothetical protein GII31_10725 [Gordonia pseudamarae]
MAFSDDELEEFYRAVEERTAWRRERPVRRARPRRARVCPTPYKECFPTPMEATDAIARSRTTRFGVPWLRSYHCDCGSWHLTSTPDYRGDDGDSSGRHRRRGRRH